MDLPTLKFPPGAHLCAPGDYVVRRTGVGRWELFRVDDLLLAKRLIPLAGDPGTLVPEEHTLDSAAPAYFDEVLLLLTAFESTFDDEPAARRAIDGQALKERAGGLLRPAREFSARDCRTVRR